jgi:hypothetical protein
VGSQRGLRETTESGKQRRYSGLTRSARGGGLGGAREDNAPGLVGRASGGRGVGGLAEDRESGGGDDGVRPAD